MNLERISSDHWRFGTHDIRYHSSFGNSGWYWHRGEAFWPPTRDSFLEVLEEILGEEHRHEIVPPPVGHNR